MGRKWSVFSLIIFLAFFWQGCADKSEEINKLIEDLSTSNMQLVEKSSARLVEIGKPAVPYLILSIKDENANKRKNIAFVLGRIGDGRAVEHLVDLLNDGDYNVRDAAAWALGEIGDKDMLPVLKKALETEKNKKVKKYLEEAIKKLE